MFFGKIGLPEIFVLLFLVLPYFLPTIIAMLRKKHNVTAIFVLNLLLGWTFIGWIVAFIWSLTTDSADRQIARPAPVGLPAGMVFCSSCGKPNAADARFCSFCGKPTSAVQQVVRT